MPELSEEDIKNMSPEQIAELQKQNCLFCSLASGKLPSKIIYDDDLVFGVIDINPATKGHVLLMPKDHYMIMPQAHEEVIKRLGKVSKLISKAMIKSMGASGTNIFIANGAVAGQRAPHLIVHIIPRNENDGINVFELPEKEANQDELNNIQKLIANKLGTRISIKPEVKTKSNELDEVDLNQIEDMLK